MPPAGAAGPGEPAAPAPVPDAPAAPPVPDPARFDAGPGEPAAACTRAPGAEPFAAPVPRTPRSRRGTVFGVVGALVALAAVGGVGYGVLHGGNDRADAKPARTPWSAPTPSATKAFGAKSGGTHFGSLSLLLLPVPAGYSPGPDVQEFGNDVVLDAGKARHLVEGDVSGLSKKDRKEADQAIDDLHIEGAGMRTYTEADDELVVQIEIVQMKNKSAARAEPKFFSAFTKAMGDLFHKGPKVKGHPYASCAVPAPGKKEKLGLMLCEATEGDLMVTMTASGTVPLEKTEAADLLARQLDRIKDPGEAV